MSNEWIKWEGGECPVKEGIIVDVKYRDGNEAIRIPAITKFNESFLHSNPERRSAEDWHDDGEDSSIAAYRIHRSCTDGDDEIPEFLKNDFKDDGLTDHEFDQPGNGIPEELAIEDVPPVLRPETVGDTADTDEKLSMSEPFHMPGKVAGEPFKLAFADYPPAQERSKYHRKIKTIQVEGATIEIWVDVYDILNACDPENRNAADDHAIKKMLFPGNRGVKDGIEDRREAIESIERSLELL